MAVPPKIYSPYENLLVALEDAATQSNTGFVAHRPSLVPCFRYVPNNHITFETRILLHEWKWRAAAAHHRITMAIHAQEEMTKDGANLIRSTVGVSYYSIENRQARLLHTVHFDYAPDSPCHPTFHAQFTDQLILPDSEIENFDIGFAQVGPPAGFFRNSRIPTSDMTLSSVLLCLAADHIGEVFFGPFRAKFFDIQAAMPKPAFNHLRNSLQTTPDHIRSSHWYAHMT
ncbi:MAG TPA: hypothetical protein VE988_05740 [Gemmataceae bacterium]|nr:hypothetical protein [Gemmataceae bacterium]